MIAAGALCGCSSGEDTRMAEESAPPPASPPPTPPPEPIPNPGLDSRPSNATCHAWNRPGANSSISLERYTSLTFDQPVGMFQAPNDSSHWYVIEQGGTVRRFAIANPVAQLVLDLRGRVRSGGEMGLLGMAFHPDFPADPRVFVSYTTGDPLHSRVSSFLSPDAGATLDASSEQIVLEVDQPETNHNGGHIAFGPDGFLYVGLGDGGGSGDRHGDRGNGQRLTTMLGKMLRIDVDSASPYAIPPDNPFASNARCPAQGRASGECPEIYAWGFRNPWRWSFDRATGTLWVADVGQGQWEEVNQVTRGGNYGWRCREGAHEFNSGTTGCDTAALIDPIAEYDHSLGNSITGGYVYRGNQASGLTGRYLFGDFGSGRIWAWIAEQAAQPRQPTQLLDTDLNISSFGEGNDGELYVVNYGGTLHRIVFDAPPIGGAVPQTLSATGCVNPDNVTEPAPGLIRYAVNAPFWSDGADMDRWLALPDGQSVQRMARRDEHGMPPLGSLRVDEAGVVLIADWIDSLEGC